MCVKIVAECKEYVLLETEAIQDTQHRVFLFIQYLYTDETRPEMRKRQKKWADLCEAKVGEPVRGAFFDLGFTATIKTYSFPWPVYFFSISTGKLDIFMVLHMTRIWDKLEAI